MNETLILVISEHRQFGWKLNLFSAELQTGSSFYLLGIPNLKEEIKKGISDTEITLINTMNEISDDALIKAYSKEKDKTKILQSTIDNLIRPRIEQNCAKILALASHANIPVYFRENIKEKAFSESNQVEILSNPSHCLFSFVKDEKGLRYFISLTNEENEISLQQTPAIILAQNPCIVLLGNKLHQVENIEAIKLTPFFTKTHIEVPVASEKMYIQKFIIKTIPKYEVKIEGIEMQEKRPRKEAVLVLEEDFYQRLCFSLFYQYDNQRFTPTLQKKKKIVNVEEINGTENICWFDRDIEWENFLFNHLISLELQREGDNRFYLKQNSEMLQKYGLIGWMNRNLNELKNYRIEQKTSSIFYQGKIELQSRLDVKIDWFDMEIEIVFDHFKIPFSRFKKHILTGNPEYVLPDGRIFIVPEEWFFRYHDFLLHSENRNNGIRLKKMYIGILTDALENLFLKDRKPNLEQFHRIPAEYPIPSEKLNKILRTYQKQGFYWLNHLYKLNFGGCLADDMGLGKTLQIIALFEAIYSGKDKQTASSLQLSLFDEFESSLPASLIVVPTSLLHNWKNELKKFAPNLKVYVHAGAKRSKTKTVNKIFRPYHIVITSYGIVRSDIEYLNKYSFQSIILDESQFIKNPASILYHAVKSLNSSHRFVLTGTPIENSLIDLWAQFNFINPGLLGNLSSFKINYINRITKEKNRQAEESLHKLIQPFLLRRTKEEVTPDLPLLSQEIVYCDMTENQEEIYMKEKSSIQNKLLENKDLFVKNKFVALQSLMRLRLLANHPVLIHPEYEGDSGKFDQILIYFESIKASGHKVLIFSSFVKYLKLLAKSFDEKNWKYVLLTGKVRDREKEIDKFNRNKDVSCFFISLKAGGTGLNLVAADYIFIIDPWWNPAAEMQALSRSHRIGQDKNVMVYRFISDNTIEEKILLLQEKKNRLSESFITSNNPLDDLKNEEIEELLSVL
ncbi:MAG: DEAD/DEAH box helicase [Dysgonamonadaceae bacterium]|jgi:SNF2 family DNA or RNA helicase|nr:DEAD/DEAH box helicase [Dysgonamonadaceae bacterium]